MNSKQALIKVDTQKGLNYYPPKLNDEQRMEMMELIARFTSVSKIIFHFKDKYDIRLSYGAITKYKTTPKWQPVIKKMREKWGIDISEVATSYKRARMEKREIYLQKLEKQNKLATALKVLDSQKEEVEPKNNHFGNVNITLNARYKDMTDEELMSRREELIKSMNQNVIEIKPEEPNGPDRPSEENSK